MRLAHWRYTLPLRLRSIFRRRRVELELDEELQFHLERQAVENIANGLTPVEARRSAERSLSGLEQRKEECRDMRKVTALEDLILEDLIKDAAYGFRLLRRNPGFSIL